LIKIIYTTEENKVKGQNTFWSTPHGQKVF